MWLLPYSTVHAVYTEYMTYCTHAQYKALQLLKADIVIGVLMNKYGLCILDEAHSIGAFPKPSKRTKLLKELFFNL